MMLNGYRKEIFRPECNPSFQSLHCYAHLDEDVSEVLPYLNTVLGASAFVKEPPSMTLEAHGKLITIHARQIAVNALKDEAEVDKILTWLKQEINDAWEKREEIEPSFEGRRKPQLIEILKLLPRTNCGECKEPTCMVFAARATEGVKGVDDCPPLKGKDKELLVDYLAQFQFE